MSTAGADAIVKGWCPGALRPMESGDGLIVRLRITGGIVDVALAKRIAVWSRHWGNGQIDLSSRSNLQLRGLSAQHLPDLHDALAECGLLDPSVAGEAVRNVICSPLAGFDPGAVLDVRPIARALEQRLADDVSLHLLPGKFGFAIDDGGLLGLDELPADIRFVARRSVDGPAFAIHLADAPHLCLGPCPADRLTDVASALSRLFLRHRTGRETEIRRMRDLLVSHDVDAIAREAGLSGLPSRGSGRPARPSALLGAHPLGSAAFVGAGLAFGRVMAKDFAALAGMAAEYGASSLRLTPWRAILVPVSSITAARAVSAHLTSLPFILGPDDPRCRIAACPGAPDCARGTTPVRSDAAAFAAALSGGAGSGIRLHASGCDKGCAHAKPAPFTLVARDGRYDLVRDGRASDPPVARHLTVEQVADYLSQPPGGGPA